MIDISCSGRVLPFIELYARSRVDENSGHGMALLGRGRRLKGKESIGTYEEL